MSSAENKLHSREVLGCDITDKANRRAVLCVETQEIFYSIREASRKTGIVRASISKCCLGKAKTAGGKHWAYVGSPIPSLDTTKKGASVVNVETGERFNSYEEAGRSVSRDGCSIRKACKGGGKCGGYHWKSFYAHDSGGGINKPVRCIETGRVYDCALDAVKELGVNSNHIGRSCRTGGTAYGYHWEWANKKEED